MYMLNAVLTRPVSMTATLAMLTPHSLFLPGAFLLQTCNGASEASLGGYSRTIAQRLRALRGLKSNTKSKKFKEIKILHKDEQEGSKVSIVKSLETRTDKVEAGEHYVRKSIMVEGKPKDKLNPRTQKEIMVYLALDGPIKIREYYSEKNNSKTFMVHLIMDCCDGPELGKLPQNLLDQFRTRDQIKLKNYVRKLLIKADNLHKSGYVHMDLKSKNIMHDQLSDDIDEMEPILIDFEQAQCFDGEKTLTKAQFGSPGFQAPEVVTLSEFRARETNIIISPKTDVYSIGCIILDLLGRKTWTKEDDFVHRDGKTALETVYKTMPADAILEKLKNRKLTKFGESFIAFMQRILTIDVHERADIKELLEHPWLNTDAHVPTDEDDQKEEKDGRRRLANRLCGAELN